MRSVDGWTREAAPAARSTSPDDAKIAAAIPASAGRRPDLTSFVSADAVFLSISGMRVAANARARVRGVLPSGLIAS